MKDLNEYISYLLRRLYGAGNCNFSQHGFGI
jgi:hypothetical protein